MNIYIFIIAALVFVFILGIQIIRPTHRGLIERLGKYNRFSNPGFHWIILVIERMFQANTIE